MGPVFGEKWLESLSEMARGMGQAEETQGEVAVEIGQFGETVGPDGSVLFGETVGPEGSVLFDETVGPDGSALFGETVGPDGSVLFDETVGPDGSALFGETVGPDESVFHGYIGWVKMRPWNFVIVGFLRGVWEESMERFGQFRGDARTVSCGKFLREFPGRIFGRCVSLYAYTASKKKCKKIGPKKFFDKNRTQCDEFDKQSINQSINQSND